MVTYTVHEREDETGGIADRADNIVFVKEGFAWTALIVPILWLLYHRLWLVLVGFIALLAAIQTGLAISGLAADVSGWATLVLSAVFALLANDLRRWTLDQRGYRVAGLAGGRDLAECEERFFTGWLAEQDARGDNSSETAKRAPRAAAAPVTSGKGGGEADDVIGLFPEPGK